MNDDDNNKDLDNTKKPKNTMAIIVFIIAVGLPILLVIGFLLATPK